MTDESIELDVIGNVEGFCSKQSKELELEIERCGVVLGIDWGDEIQVRALAHEALEHVQQDIEEYENRVNANYELKAKVTLFALADMMMQLMARSADKGIHTHGGPAWKSFSKALMKERGVDMLSDSG